MSAAELEGREKVWAAVEHGVTRRKDGYDEPLLIAEYHLLRRALWDYVRRNTRPGEALEVITRIDTAISLATMASIRGYHRPELEARGNWSDALRKLIEESPLLEHAGSTT